MDASQGIQAGSLRPQIALHLPSSIAFQAAPRSCDSMAICGIYAWPHSRGLLKRFLSMRREAQFSSSLSLSCWRDAALALLERESGCARPGSCELYHPARTPLIVENNGREDDRSLSIRLRSRVRVSSTRHPPLNEPTSIAGGEVHPHDVLLAGHGSEIKNVLLEDIHTVQQISP
ncbi:hypothetical protein OE88DRAFT_392155 [Heliocybe sulcata]|uniref:Uncharacterized protein n=1 Tax=Heliocybe sulcata TaxID=5364 RepID=A0A5C3N7S9_9AGAM|nr:hypothetical protein OE88DRAFT_392155 [Heliocybe sulcata]